MKMLLILYTGSDPSRISRWLDEQGVEGYTECGPVHGAGRSGRYEGTRAWPGGGQLVFTFVPDERVEPLRAALEAERTRLPEAERLHAGVLPVETFF